MKKNKKIEIESIEITHPEKIIFPKLKLTKLDMVHYYESISEKILPFLKDRPLTLQRFPNGISKEGFYQKSAGDYFPSFIQTVEIPTEEGSNTQVVCNTKKSLIYLVNQGTLSFHIWLAKKDKLHKPDKVIFDLDPSENDFKKVKEAAQITGDFLRKQNIEPRLMTTGQNGLHVWYTIRRTKEFDQVREEVKKMAEKLAEKHPKLLTTAVRKDKRKGKIFVDYLRNSYAQTAICPYSLRPNEQAGIATPIAWEDFEKLKSSDQFHLKKE